jgi:hypothetical protein
MKQWIFLFGLLLLTVSCNKETSNAVDFLQGDLAFVADKSNVQVVNITNPAQPEWVSTIALPGQVMKVVVDGRFAYIIYQQYLENNSGGLQILDMVTPAQPAVRATYDTPHLLTNVTVQGNLLALAHLDGVTLLDVADKNAPQTLAELPSRSNGVYLDGAQLITTWGDCDFRSGLCAGGLRVYDVSKPQKPTEISTLEQHDLPGFDVAVTAGHAFVNGKGVWVAELTGEPQLQMNGRYETGPGYLYNGPIAIQDNIAFAATNPDSLYLLDISQPSTPTELSRYRASYVYDLTVRGHHAYLVTENHLEIVDISNPTSPQLVGSYVFPNSISSAPQSTATP